MSQRQGFRLNWLLYYRSVLSYSYQSRNVFLRIRPHIHMCSCEHDPSTCLCFDFDKIETTKKLIFDVNGQFLL